MKKRIVIILFAALFLCACVPTPDEPLVLQKDQDLMIQQGSATLSPEQPYTPPEVPERYQFEYREGTLTIRADAEVVVPSASMPIMNVRAQGIPQETMYRLFQLLSDGEVLYLPHPRTKSEVETEIKHCYEMMEYTSDAWEGRTQEEYLQEIDLRLDALKQEYQNAPDTLQDWVSDGTYETTSFPDMTNECRYLEAENSTSTLYVLSCENADFDSLLMFTRTLHDLDGDRSYSAIHPEPIDKATELPDDLNYDDAAACAQKFLDATGNSYEIARAYLIDDTVEDIMRDTVRYALCFDCRRLVNGVPLAVDITDWGDSDQKSYSIPWRQEGLRIVVDADGIFSVSWQCPLTVQDTVSEATDLMPFETVKGIAEKMLPIMYMSNGKRDITVSFVRLELIRVREQNNTAELQGLLVPVWVFYGSIEETRNNDDGTTYNLYSTYGATASTGHYNGDVIVLCINAIDGSIIDPMLGY